MSFYSLDSEKLKERLGVKDKRTVINRLKEMGVRIVAKGSHQYVIEEDILKSLLTTPSDQIKITGGLASTIK